MILYVDKISFNNKINLFKIRLVLKKKNKNKINK